MTGVTVTEVVFVLPCCTETVFGEAPRVKLAFGAVVTVRETVVVALRLPLVPLMVTVLVPVDAVDEAVKVTVVLPLPATVPPKFAVTPVGSPEAVKLTVPLKPLEGVTVIVLAGVPVAPC